MKKFFRELWLDLSDDDRLGLKLFVAGLVTYLVTRLFRITVFPAYFFCDEANQAVQAKSLLDSGFSMYGMHFPPYLDQFGRFILGTTVYLHLVADRLFGMTFFGVRAVSALTSVLMPLSLGAVLRFGFKCRTWWLAAWVPLLIPCWFVHSRTAFETTVWVALYATCALVYVLYRYRDARFLYALPPVFAAAFFTYQTAPIVLGVTGILLGLSDFTYHRRHRRVLTRTFVLFALLVGLPYLRATLYLAYSPLARMRADFDTIFWFQPISTMEKLSEATKLYLAGVNPAYWLGPEPLDLARHRVPGYRHLPLALVPLFLLGLVRTLQNLHRSGYRLVLALLLAVPFGGAIVGPTITRLLAFLVPFTLLTVLGADRLIAAIAKLRPDFAGRLPYAALGLFAFGGLGLTVDATMIAPRRWTATDYRDMQWGFPQLAEKIMVRAASEPATIYYLDPEWANGTDVFPQFFFPGNANVRVRALDNHFLTDDTRLDDKIFIMPPSKSSRIRERGKFTVDEVDRLAFPNGEIAFVFVAARATPQARTILSEEQQALLTMRKGVVTLRGEKVSVRYSPLDIGQIADAFDDNTYTVVRGAAANPFVLELIFPRPRELRGVAMHLNDGLWHRTAVLETEGRRRRFTDERKEPVVAPEERALYFGGERLPVRRLRLELQQPDEGGTAHAHVHEIKLID